MNQPADTTDIIKLANHRIDALEGAVRDLLSICQFATFDNGVEHQGRNEGDYLAGVAIDKARALISQSGVIK